MSPGISNRCAVLLSYLVFILTLPNEKSEWNIPTQKAQILPSSREQRAELWVSLWGVTRPEHWRQISLEAMHILYSHKNLFHMRQMTEIAVSHLSCPFSLNFRLLLLAKVNSSKKAKYVSFPTVCYTVLKVGSTSPHIWGRVTWLKHISYRFVIKKIKFWAHYGDLAHN